MKAENLNLNINLTLLPAMDGVTGDIYSKGRVMGYIYRTINTLTGEFYIGKSHKEPHENPDYLGSGLRLNGQIRQYGRSVFKKEILEDLVADDIIDELEIKEIKEHREFFGDDLILNVAAGGNGGNTLQGKSEEEIKQIRLKQAATLKEGYESGRITPYMLGRKHTPEAKAKNAAAKLGEKNPQFGKTRTQEEKDYLSAVGQERMKDAEERARCNAWLGLNDKEIQERKKTWSEVKKRGKNGRAKTVQDTETGQIFDCLRTACDELNLNINTEKWRRSKGRSRLVDVAKS